MEKGQRVQVERFGRVLQIGQTFQRYFGEGSPAAVALGRLAAIVTGITDDGAARVARSRAGRDKQPSAREALVRRLDAIARTARVIGRAVPGFAEPFALPRPKRDDVIRSTTAAFLKDAEPLAARFIERGLPADFIVGLRTALAEFEQATAAKRDGRLARVSAVAGIREAIKQGREVVEEIDVIVRYQHASDAELQAAWANAKRLDRPAASGKVTPKPPAPVVPAPVSPPVLPAASADAGPELPSDQADAIEPAA